MGGLEVWRLAMKNVISGGRKEEKKRLEERDVTGRERSVKERRNDELSSKRAERGMSQVHVTRVCAAC